MSARPGPETCTTRPALAKAAELATLAVSRLDLYLDLLRPTEVEAPADTLPGRARHFEKRPWQPNNAAVSCLAPIREVAVQDMT